jgi:hypothetical protein
VIRGQDDRPNIRRDGDRDEGRTTIRRDGDRDRDNVRRDGDRRDDDRPNFRNPRELSRDLRRKIDVPNRFERSNLADSLRFDRDRNRDFRDDDDRYRRDEDRFRRDFGRDRWDRFDRDHRHDYISRYRWGDDLRRRLLLGYRGGHRHGVYSWWNHYPDYGSWYYLNAYHSRPYYWWRWGTWPVVSSWYWGSNVDPYYYDYGTTVVYRVKYVDVY